MLVGLGACGDDDDGADVREIGAEDCPSGSAFRFGVRFSVGGRVGFGLRACVGLGVGLGVGRGVSQRLGQRVR